MRTPDDFGTTGDRPAHPELLDWLACELIRGGWRLKPIHRIIMSSDAYRLGVAFDPARAAIDPENRLLWHRRPIRLEAEAYATRCSRSAASSTRQCTGHPSAREFRPRRSRPGARMPTRPTSRTAPRSVVARSTRFIKRSVPDPAAEVFDAPDPTPTCGRRNMTAVPTQNLALLNDPFVRDVRGPWPGVRPRRPAPERRDRVRRAYELAFGRPPARRASSGRPCKFLSESGNADAWTDLCHVLFTLNEFLYID